MSERALTSCASVRRRTGRRSSLQRSLAAAVTQGAIPETIVLLEHPPTVTVGRRTGDEELHVLLGADVDVLTTDRGGKSTYHAPGQLVCYPILDLKRHGRDVKRYRRDLEEAVIGTLAAFDLAGTASRGSPAWAHGPAAEDRVDRRPHIPL